MYENYEIHLHTFSVFKNELKKAIYRYIPKLIWFSTIDDFRWKTEGPGTEHSSREGYEDGEGHLALTDIKTYHKAAIIRKVK